MNKKVANEAFSRAQERNESAYDTFQSEFEKQIASAEELIGVVEEYCKKRIEEVKD